MLLSAFFHSEEFFWVEAYFQGNIKLEMGKNNLIHGDFSVDLYDSKEIITEFGFLMTSEFLSPISMSYFIIEFSYWKNC